MELIALGDRGQDMVRAATYERQSHRSETDSQASPQMQREKSVAFIKSQNNWTHVDTDYSDVGLSGYDPNVVRPGFERLMADAKAGKFDVVVIYMLSRLTRQGAAEALRIQQELAKCGVALVSTQEPFINTSDDNPFGVAFFALIAGLAHQESKNKSKFIRDSFAKLRAKGSHSSGPVPFGFQAVPVNVDGLTVRILSPGAEGGKELGPESSPADAVKFMISKALDGARVNAIATKLTELRVPTALASLDDEAAAARRKVAARRRKSGPADEAGLEWSPTVVLRVLRDPRLAGFAIGPVDQKTKRRTIMRDDEGAPIQPHTGFMTATEWYRLQQILDGRKQERRRDRTGERTLLGSWGILRCGRCESGLTVARATESYVCNLRRSVGDEPKHVLRVGMDHADSIVAQRVWARLGALDPSDPDDIEWLSVAAERFAVQGADPEAAAELAEQEAQLQHVQQSMEELYADRRDGLYEGKTGRTAFADTIRKYQQHEERCAERIAELTSSATSSARLPVDEWFADSDGDPFAPGGLWERWDVDERRAFLALFVDRVTVAASETKQGPAKERAEKRIEVHWATREVEEEDTQVTN
ncbi:recombinase family protein [Streptomyces sp. NPDC091376]|uniref:recombinase family protein n=1 Tax=Streptomyces sp. NPDC091376 TaxID=3365994 RepID=UPI00382C6901